MLPRLLAAAACLLPLPAIAAGAIGYGIANQLTTDPVPDVGGGLELRATFGGDRGDRWSIWLGAQPQRRTKESFAFGIYVDTMPAYAYVAGLRRFNLHLDGPITLFAGTGLGYRDLTTCTLPPRGGKPTDTSCFGGDAFVSSRWAFAQELGFRWRAVELSLGHFSTGGISVANKGVNLVRFTLFRHVGMR